MRLEKGEGVSHAEKQALHDDRGGAAWLLRRLARWSFRIIIVLALLIGVALALYVFWLPGYAETRIAGVLRDMGLKDAQVRVGHIGLDRSTLHDVVIGDDRLRIEQLRVTYDTAGLRQGRVKTLSIIGLTLTVGITESGELDLSPLTEIEPPPPDSDDQGWPVDRIELVASRLIVQQAGGQTWTLPVSGHVALADTTAQLQLASVLPDRRLTLNATANRSGDDWSVQDGRLQLTPADLTLPGTAVVARGLAADVRFTGEMNTEQLTLTIEPESAIALADVDGDLAGVDVARGAADKRLLRVTPAAPVVIAIARGDEQAGWQAEAADLRLSLATPRLTLTDGNVQFDALQATLALGVNATPNGVTVTFPQPARVAWSQLLSGDITAGAATLLVRGEEEAPTATWRDGTFAASLVAAAEESLQVRGPKFIATLPQLRMPAQFTVPPDAPFTALAQLNTAGATAASVESEPAWAVRDISAQIPLTWNATPQAAGNFTIGAIEAGDVKLPGLRGEAAFVDNRIAATAAWPLTEELKLQLAANLQGGEGEVRITAPPTVIANPRTFAQLVPALGAIDIDGVFTLDGRVAIADGELNPHIKLEANNASIRHKELGIDATGILATLVIDSFDPLASPSQQYIAADQVKLGEMTFNDWIVWFRLDDAQHLFIEETRWVMGDAGRFITFAIPLNFEDPKLRTQLFVEDLDLQTWMSTLTGENVEATGELYGRIAVSFDPDARDPLQFDPGFLYTAPGGGTLRFQDQATVRTILETAGAGLEAAGENLKERLVESLINYQYDMFRFDIIPREGQPTVLRIQTSGEGLNANAVPIGNLTVNIGGFQEATNTVLGFKAGLDRLQERTLNPASRSNRE